MCDKKDPNDTKGNETIDGIKNQNTHNQNRFKAKLPLL